VELPRYQSRSVTTPSSISPAQAGAGAAALSEAFAKGFDVTSQVTGMIAKAEAEMAAQAALADLRAEVTTFTADPRWLQPEIVEELPPGQQGPVRGARPTAEVLAEEWQKKRRQILAKTPAIGWRETRAQFEAQRQQILATAGAEVVGQQRKLQVDRGKALAEYSIEMAMRSGEFGVAGNILNSAFEQGLLSFEDRAKLALKVQDRQAEEEALQRMDPRSGFSTGEVIDWITGNPNMPPTMRNRLLRTMESRMTSLQRQEERDEKARRDKAYTDAVVATRDMAPEQARQFVIENPDLPEPARRTMLAGLDVRERAMEGTPEGQRELSEIKRRVLRDPTWLNQAFSEMDVLLATGFITGKELAEAGPIVVALAKAGLDDPVFDREVRLATKQILKGQEFDSQFSMFRAEERDQMVRAATEFETAAFRALVDARQNRSEFDARKWVDENLPRYLKQADVGKNYDYLAVGLDPKLAAGRGNFDPERTRLAIIAAQERGDITPEQAIEAAKYYGIKK
jgi:hypothetical protein